MHYFCSSSGWLYPPEGEGKNQRKWGAPGSLTRISAFNKIRERHVSLISARCLRVSIPMQIIHDDSAESGEPKPGDEEYKLTISGTAILLTLRTRGSVAGEYLIPPDNLRGRDDRSPLLRVWQEHANCCLSLCRKQYCFREREPPAKTVTKRKDIPWR